MKKYRVNVNGTDYDITIELIEDGGPAAPAAPAAKPAGGGEQVNSPMPGTILDIKVSAGDRVRKGQVLLVMEAMKMENEIQAPRDGLVVSVNVSRGASVDFDDLLVVIE